MGGLVGGRSGALGVSKCVPRATQWCRLRAAIKPRPAVLERARGQVRARRAPCGSCPLPAARRPLSNATSPQPSRRCSSPMGRRGRRWFALVLLLLLLLRIFMGLAEPMGGLPGDGNVTGRSSHPIPPSSRAGTSSVRSARFSASRSPSELLDGSSLAASDNFQRCESARPMAMPP